MSIGVPVSRDDPTDRNTPTPVVILGIPFHDVSFAEAVEWTRQRVLSRRPAYIATANMDFIMQAWRDPELQRILLEADLVVADGIPIVWLSRLLGPGLKGRVTGSDLVPLLAELSAREGFSLYGLGGAEGVAAKATARLVQRYPGLTIAGCYSPPKADILNMNNADILARIEAAGPDILLVAFGAPKQEKWVHLHIRTWSVPVSIGVGGSLDFLAGAQTRAPKWIRTLALEWLWRMLSDPRRLVKRYAANILFLISATLRMLWLRFAPVRPARQSAGLSTPVKELEWTELNARRYEFPDTSDAEGLNRFHAECARTTSTQDGIIGLNTRSWLNSLDLGTLLSLSRTCRAKGNRLIAIAARPRVARLLRFLRLDAYLQVVETDAEAIQYLRQRRATQRQGGVSTDPERTLTLSLPVELTAATTDAFRIRMEVLWRDLENRDGLLGVRIDASATEFIDSAGLGFLVSVQKKADQTRIRYACDGFRDGALRTLRLTRLDSILLRPAD